MPARQRRVGLQEIGLPYAADPAVTRHLARFLRPRRRRERRRAHQARPERARLPHARALQRRRHEGRGAARAVVEVLSRWLAEEGFEPLDARHVLDAPDLDHAVAQGAAYYGLARRGRGVRIRSGAPRTYYVGIESAMPAVPGLPAPLKALCVVPFGMEEGTSAVAARPEFGLVVGEPAEFRFFSSHGPQDGSRRRDDRGLGRRARGAEPARSDAAGCAAKGT